MGFYPELHCDDGTVKTDSPLKIWAENIMSATKKLGRSADAPKYYQENLHNAGWTDITVVPDLWPINRWPRDRRCKELGHWSLANIGGGLQGFSLALFTRQLGWTTEEVEVFLVDVRKDVNNPAIHGYWPM